MNSWLDSVPVPMMFGTAIPKFFNAITDLCTISVHSHMHPMGTARTLLHYILTLLH